MTSDGNTPNDSARWERLVEAEACGTLSSAERAELERLATERDEHRWERQVLTSIPKLVPSQTELRGEDRALIDRVLQLHTKERRRRSRTAAWGAALLIPLSAAAAYLVQQRSPPELTSPVSSAPTPTTPVPTPSATAQEQPAEEPAEEPTPAAENTTPPPTHRPSPPSASELLTRAQKARASRNYAGAAQAYRELLRRYPTSGEAGVARLSLAQLHLAEGNAAAALAGFDAYQRGGGQLSQEAHYGRIAALHALGRTAEEQAEIERFIARYPNSLQAPALRRRLGKTGGPN